MLEFIFVGRGGQGVVIAEEILAEALFYQGYHVKSFPSFGTERRGAPVKAFLRVSAGDIKESCQIYKPDYYILFDDSQADKLPKNIKGVINSNSKADSNLIKVNAGHIALNNRLGTSTNPIINTSILGSIAALIEGFSFLNFEIAIKNN